MTIIALPNLFIQLLRFVKQKQMSYLAWDCLGSDKNDGNNLTHLTISNTSCASQTA